MVTELSSQNVRPFPAVAQNLTVLMWSTVNGQMSPSQRGQALSKIKQDPEVVVFLLSFNAGGVGMFS